MSLNVDKYSVKDMTFRWKKENPITFPKDFDEGFFRLPKYVVSFSTEQDPHIIFYGDVDHCSARLEITLSRELKSYLLEHYLPSTLFVSMSWGSFVVIPEIVPGRMVTKIWNKSNLLLKQLRIILKLCIGLAGHHTTYISNHVQHCAEQQSWRIGT